MNPPCTPIAITAIFSAYIVFEQLTAPPLSAAQAKAYSQQKDRMHQQESEIAALKRQLESMQIAASRARAGGAGRRQMDGSMPAEYVCPITQVRPHTSPLSRLGRKSVSAPSRTHAPALRARGQTNVHLGVFPARGKELSPRSCNRKNGPSSDCQFLGVLLYGIIHASFFCTSVDVMSCASCGHLDNV